MEFTDEQNNYYYTKRDQLFVKLTASQQIRHIGAISYSFSANTVSLLVRRRSIERTQFGYMLPAAPFEHLAITRLLLFVDNKDGFIIDDVPAIQDKLWPFQPNKIYERQVVVPDAFWKPLIDDTIIVTK